VKKLLALSIAIVLIITALLLSSCANYDRVTNEDAKEHKKMLLEKYDSIKKVKIFCGPVKLYFEMEMKNYDEMEDLFNEFLVFAKTYDLKEMLSEKNKKYGYPNIKIIAKHRDVVTQYYSKFEKDQDDFDYQEWRVWVDGVEPYYLWKAKLVDSEFEVEKEVLVPDSR